MPLNSYEFCSKGKNKDMKLFKAATTVGFITLLGAALAPSVMADRWDQKTTFTFSGPVEIPGVHLKGFGVLPAGTYVFKILDSGSDRNIVQILSQDELTVYATILAIPDIRLKPTDKTVLTFRERPAGEPEALRAWFYPGTIYGQEFVYSKSVAVELAKSSNTAVLFAPDAIPVEVAEPVKTVDAPVVVQLRQAPVMAIQPSGQEVQLAEVVTPPPPATLVAQSLPATASPLPLIALLGFLALGGAFVLRSAEKRAL
jgi:hypothetical protein